jgi:O-succinylbenzoic acid--CoA ligase
MPDTTPSSTPAVSLTVAGRQYGYQQLLAWDEAQASSALSENDRATLQFAREWLSGSQRFALQTSGSTGTPKPIYLARSQMEASARATGAALGLHAGQQALVCLPIRYVAGRMMLVRGFVLNLAVHVVEPASDPFSTLDAAVRPDFAAFIPLQMQTLLDIARVEPGDSCYADDTSTAFRYRRLLEGMQAILIGGGPISATLHNQIQQLSAPVYHTYGMTETATHVALRRLGGPQRSDAFVPLPGVELALDDRGCLAIRGNVTKGEWLQTNDIVDLRSDGSFVWLGRWDNVINSGGVKVQIEAVEAAVTALQVRRSDLAWASRRLAIVGLPDERLGQVVALVLEGLPLPAAAETAIEDALRAGLDRFALPRHLAYLPELPLTPTGKVNRTALSTLLAERPTPPADPSQSGATG